MKRNQYGPTRRFHCSVAYEKLAIPLTCIALLLLTASAEAADFDGLEMNLGSLPRLSNALTRSVSPENFTGQKWKVSPSVRIKPGETFVMADIKAAGAIQHIWMTPTGDNRLNIFRIYWDDEKTPSVECPAGDFFACGMGQYTQVTSQAVCVNPGSGFNCYWTMPFRRGCKVTMTNVDTKAMTLYYQIDYTVTHIPDDMAYFHAQFRRVNPLPDKQDYTIVEGIKGQGHYIGTYMVWGSNSPGWWGEGEIKFFMDGDEEFPTICGTGTEDYFCGSYGFHKPGTSDYQIFSTPFAGMPQVILSEKQPRFGLYRWHIMDPIRFQKDLRVTIQALGWQSEGRYLPLQDDLSSVAYWYQTEPHAAFPKLPAKKDLLITEP
jgi:D-arabinan exo alpha-(1,3)/(1,5)-arabinofuranosidase (non-reducing end)